MPEAHGHCHARRPQFKDRVVATFWPLKRGDEPKEAHGQAKKKRT
jgi:hypothetical protein